ncbi:DUF1552 domain-containing protein [Roseibacillus ishigakijimensis]|uniref:DUF1552 domain-containing protein n=1 Tax=Roseibacillus ishigakijimensis TaxID=454146 RepID=A0A934RLT7_9BACT|nr:DUF1552 domain-containing protein [Roseibacillus ishigakijimensis]MBK1833140.1 DUF1552 domain-containing protein [Roseibacillus ishigakijimensis]
MNRRHFLRDLGISSAALPFLSSLPSFAETATVGQRKQRLLIVFSPNGTIPDLFWPSNDEGGQLQLSPILKPLEPFKKDTLVIKGLANKVRGDGDSHMRGMSCLLTGAPLLKGNIRGGGGNPAGWASSLSIDQEIRNFLQSRDNTRTRFGSLEVGVAVPNRADPWTRMSYAGANRPMAPLNDPEEMLAKLYGHSQDSATYASLLDELGADFKKVAKGLPPEDRALLDQHLTLVRQMEEEMKAAAASGELVHPEPEIDPNIELVNDNTPEIARMQMDLLVNALANDMARIGSLQFMRSVGQARMNWLGIEDGHHSLSHEPDGNEQAREKLVKINTWFAEQVAYLAQKLRDTPETHGEGNMLDNTTIVWVNELGKGNNHTLDDIPIVLIGGGAGFQRNRLITLPERQPLNRLHLSLAQSFGHQLETFGDAQLSQGGALNLG